VSKLPALSVNVGTMSDQNEGDQQGHPGGGQAFIATNYPLASPVDRPCRETDHRRLAERKG
jgi:hypothetical protein